MSANKGARLWFRPARGTRAGRWFIRDGQHSVSTGCGAHDRAGAEQALAAYIARKHVKAQKRGREPSVIPGADVFARYLTDVAAKRSRPGEFAARATALLAHFGRMTLADINGDECRRYAATHPRRHLEDLRAAIRHHHREGLCSVETKIVLPEGYGRRERWLTRTEAARLLRACWRGHRRRHVARFVLVALYTGSRAGAVCGAAVKPTEGHGFIDYERGVFYRRGEGERETKKRRPPVRLPERLLAHMRRWRRLKLSRRFVIEYDGKPVGDIWATFHRAAIEAGLSGVSPHTLRHTAATWLMQNGADKYEAAGFLGMTMATLEARYAHHHPDHLRGAAEAITRRGPARPKAQEAVVKMMR